MELGNRNQDTLARHQARDAWPQADGVREKSPGGANSASPIGDRLRAIAAQMSSGEVAALLGLAKLYHAEVEFEDPMQSLQGREAFVEMNRRALVAAREYHIEFDEIVEDRHRVFARWTMRYRAKRGPRFVISGVSFLQLVDGQVLYHRDYWDLASSLLNSVPWVGRAYRRALRLLG